MGKLLFSKYLFVWVDKLLLRNSIFRRKDDQAWLETPTTQFSL